VRKQKEDAEMVGHQLMEARQGMEKESEAHKRIRKENLGLQDQLNETKRREAELQAQQRQLVKL
jgi:hypothetical protein